MKGWQVGLVAFAAFLGGWFLGDSHQVALSRSNADVATACYHDLGEARSERNACWLAAVTHGCPVR
jgi:hypothetical protein